jgi:NADP-dependent 3-hydroxy acid dehydrogenase YdfG
VTPALFRYWRPAPAGLFFADGSGHQPASRCDPIAETFGMLESFNQSERFMERSADRGSIGSNDVWEQDARQLVAMKVCRGAERALSRGSSSVGRSDSGKEIGCRSETQGVCSEAASENIMRKNSRPATPLSSPRSVRKDAKKAAREERATQRKIDRTDKESARKKASEAVQAGARVYPVPPLPGQHLEKPGLEADLKLAPMYDAPHHRGSEKLLDMVALVTGGDSGIGRSVAVLFAREGADVAVAYLDEDEDASSTKRAVEKEGRRCILLSGDVADPTFCKAAVKKTIEEFGKLDILVNNAAFQEHVNTFEDLNEEQFDHTIKTNLYGYFHMAKAAVPEMKNGTSIIMTGSVTGILGNKDLLDYSTTKGAIHAFAASLAGSSTGSPWSEARERS